VGINAVFYSCMADGKTYITTSFFERKYWLYPIPFSRGFQYKV
jgi:hypothetical protein